VRALYVSGSTIAVTYPDTARTIDALKSLDLFVVAAHTMTPTAAWADLVLPKTTTLEEEEINLNQKAPCVTYTAATSRPDGDVKSDLDIAVDLIDRLAARGRRRSEIPPVAHARRIQRLSRAQQRNRHRGAEESRLRGISLCAAQLRGASLCDAERQDRTLFAEYGAQRHDPLPAYIPPAYAREDAATVADYPLVLQTGLREKTFQHSRFPEQAWTKKVSPDPVVYIHPEMRCGRVGPPPAGHRSSAHPAMCHRSLSLELTRCPCRSRLDLDPVCVPHAEPPRRFGWM